MKFQNNIPELRFPEFAEDWEITKVGSIITRVASPVIVQEDEIYKQIGIRSHGKGIFHKEKTTGKEIGNKRVFWIVDGAFIVNIVFAWEHAVAKTTEAEIGMIASHRFPMYLPKDSKSNIDYLLHFFLTPKGKTLLELASPGGAGRNKTLGQAEFLKQSFKIPSVLEQQKIASFFTTIDQKISQLKLKKSLLEQYKKGVMQKIFSQEIRFRDENGQEFPKWEKMKLGEVGHFQTSSVDKLSRKGEKEVRLVNYMNVYRHEDINQDSLNNLQEVTATEKQILTNNLQKGDILFTPSSETSSDIGHSVVIFEDLLNCLYSYHLMRFRPTIKLDILYSHYFCNIPKVLAQLSKLATGSTRFTISVKSFSSIEVSLPTLAEQSKIATFLSAIDNKINHTKTQIEKAELWKKGLLQKMFV
jgi:type I restriction enzyme S subunit